MACASGDGKDGVAANDAVCLRCCGKACANG